MLPSRLLQTSRLIKLSRQATLLSIEREVGAFIGIDAPSRLREECNRCILHKGIALSSAAYSEIRKTTDTLWKRMRRTVICHQKSSIELKTRVS